MTRIEIDEAMISRAARLLGCGSPHNREDVRRALDAALNPPPEPEITVTDEMAAVGQKWFIDMVRRGALGDGELWWLAKNVYRAMRKLEPGQKPNPIQPEDVTYVRVRGNMLGEKLFSVSHNQRGGKDRRVGDDNQRDCRRKIDRRWRGL
jgi:hypothetical protein